ncbi:MAG: His/Gly/Thr/Pro-type tRNA ligase C-terminal domain-containing protein [Candidatus Taylorbacteria bacterium]|nr:His/Gly/Thr/Pro-type tRNA ligase C-terminal domain-containing protein [Candidatus Taylorbacteria bacterium]
MGFRYDGLTQKIGHKRDVPGVGIKIFLNKKKIIKKISKLEKPKVFYIQLGDEAKNKSLGVIDMLRKEQIYLYHMLGRDKLGSQFAFVEKMKIPYVIIMGKKEFLEDSVMVRENSTRTQESVKITELARYIRKLK